VLRVCTGGIPVVRLPNNEVWQKLTPHQRQEALARLESGKTQSDVARDYNVSRRTIG
jgi:DNA-binding NarL/FixJ family response regulator